MGIECLAPCCSGIGEEDVNMVGCLRDFGNELFYLGEFGAVGGDRDSPRVGVLGGQGVEGFTGFGAGFGFAGGDVDFGASGLDEARGEMKGVSD